MKNKILLLAALLALGVTSCGGKPAEPSSEQGNESQIVTPSSEQQGQTSKQDDPSSQAVTPSSEVTPQSSEAPASSQPAESSLPPEEQPQDYELCTMIGCENGDNAVKGKLIYWFGEGGNLSISDGTGDDKDYLIVDYSAGWQWFSGQIFVATPYAEEGDILKVEFDVIPTVAGTITVNHVTYNLQANQVNHIKYKVTVESNLRAIDLQFGVYENNVIYPNCKFKFTQPTIKPFNGTYHKVSFGMMMGTTFSEATSYYVKHGQKLFYVMDVSAFASALPAGMVVKGWKDNGGQYASTDTVINADKQYTLEIVNESAITKRTITYKLGNQVIHTEQVNDGVPTSAPQFTWKEIGFGYGAAGYYDNDGLTQEHDFSATVSSDQVIYVKRVLNPTIWMAWPAAPEAVFTATENKYSITGLNCGIAPGNQAYEVQINFPNFPTENGVSYTLSFKYKLTANYNGNCQVWDSGITSGFGICTLTADGEEHAVTKTYQGSDYSIDSYEKITFELGQCDNGTSIEIYDFWLVAA